MMGHIKTYFLCIVLLYLQQQVTAQLPQVYSIDAAKVATIKKDAASPRIAENIKQLARQADKFMDAKFGSVMDKKYAPPCGNMHEYFSKAKYFWPDPTKADGLPYIRKDGQKNPDNDLISDDKNFDNMIGAVHTLSWAYYFTDKEKYAEKCINLIRFWFLDTATYMAPNLNHAQVRMGIDTGSNSGLIDTHQLPEVIDAIGLLRSSKLWKTTDEQGMKQWFSSYLNWLRTSKNGIKESKEKNNHRTFYDNQIVTIALYCDEEKIADKMLQSEYARIASQIEPDGKQPLELERTLALSYSTFNLEAWSLLATAAATQGVDLWHYETKDGRSIRKAIDFLMPYALGEKKWEYQQINPYKAYDYYRILLIAADEYKDDTYRKAAEKIKESNKNIFVKLFYE